MRKYQTIKQVETLSNGDNPHKQPKLKSDTKNLKKKTCVITIVHINYLIWEVEDFHNISFMHANFVIHHQQNLGFLPEAHDPYVLRS